MTMLRLSLRPSIQLTVISAGGNRMKTNVLGSFLEFPDVSRSLPVSMEAGTINSGLIMRARARRNRTNLTPCLYPRNFATSELHIATSPDGPRTRHLKPFGHAEVC